MRFLRQSTATVVAVGVFPDPTTGAGVTGLASQSGRLTKAGTGSAFTPASWAHDYGGHYLVGLAAGDTDTLGRLRVAFSSASYLPVWEDFSVLSAAVYDWLFGAAAPNTDKAGFSLAAAQAFNNTGQTSNLPTADSAGTTTLLSRLTSGRATNLDNLDAAISTRSTYAGADTSGTTTLLARLTAPRAGYLDNLNVGGPVASSAEATAIQNNTRVVRVVPPVIERPDAGSTTFRIELYLYDEVGNMEAPDSAPTLALVNQAGVDLSARLDSTTMAPVSTGRYRAIYTASVGDALDQLVWTFSVAEGGATRLYGNTSLIVDTTAVDFTATDRATLAGLPDAVLSASVLGRPANSLGQYVDSLAFNSNTFNTMLELVGGTYWRIKTQAVENVPPAVAAAILADPANKLATSGTGGVTADVVNDKTAYELAPSEHDNIAFRTLYATDAEFDYTSEPASIGSRIEAIAAIRAVADKLDAMIVAAGPDWQFDATALELAPAASGGGSVTVGGYAAGQDPESLLDARIDALDAGQAAIAGYLDTEVAAIKAKTDQLTFTGPNLNADAKALPDPAPAGYGGSGSGGGATAAEVVDALMASTIEVATAGGGVTVTFKAAIAYTVAGAGAGLVSGVVPTGPATVTINAAGQPAGHPRMIVSGDGSGNRTAITLVPPT